LLIARKILRRSVLKRRRLHIFEQINAKKLGPGVRIRQRARGLGGALERSHGPVKAFDKGGDESLKQLCGTPKTW
jgi:hypothetical protein